MVPRQRRKGGGRDAGETAQIEEEEEDSDSSSSSSSEEERRRRKRKGKKKKKKQRYSLFVMVGVKRMFSLYYILRLSNRPTDHRQICP